ncbi:MAG: peptidoglycan DD-metalloendopeptidase family protein [Sulfurospirillaceae bacterium]|nr:peptidoglycan DD-metalloendopeptidase family protein [Sulfurospirillaceae bacterium]MDD2827931.1 peptidoglycan DD-metalloendopeptidase family protein [Sulfurospirillaceae bacterium]
MLKFLWVLLGFLSLSYGAYVEELKWPKGDTFLTFLGKNSIPSSLYYSLDKEEQELAAEIVAGIKYQVLHDDNGLLEQALIPIGDELQMHIMKNNDHYTMEIIPVVYKEEALSLSISIENSPYLDIVKATNNYILANEFVQSFRGGVNFRGLQKGDKLVLFYKGKSRLGKQYGGITIDVSMLETGNKKHYMFFYKENYYDQTGKQLERFLLSIPVNYRRISSEFTTKRWHPILHKFRAHLGVDYAANIGTPVKSAGNGKIIYAGEKGGYGNTIMVDHAGPYKTLYGHLNNFARGIKKGKSVKQGEVIGYVGNTGMSSGPHLHFGLYRNETAINPGSVIKVEKNALSSQDMKKFQTYIASLKNDVEKALINPSEPRRDDDFAYSEPLVKTKP